MSDRKAISKLVEEGKISTEQAEMLLAKLELADFLSEAGRVKTLKIKMEDCQTRKVQWEETVPIYMVKLGLKMSNKVWHDAVKKYPDLKNFDINFRQMVARLSKDEPGTVATLISQDSSRQLNIWLE